MRPVNPAELLREEFMKGSDPPINANTHSEEIETLANRISTIINGQRSIPGDTVGRLGGL